MARKFILCSFQDLLHAIVPAEQEDSRLERARERETYSSSCIISIEHISAPTKRTVCSRDAALRSRACWWAVLQRGGRIFQRLPPHSPHPSFFAPDFLAPEEGATHMRRGRAQRWFWPSDPRDIKCLQTHLSAQVVPHLSSALALNSVTSLRWSAGMQTTVLATWPFSLDEVCILFP